jgi:hypothetical protein
MAATLAATERVALDWFQIPTSTARPSRPIIGTLLMPNRTETEAREDTMAFLEKKHRKTFATWWAAVGGRGVISSLRRRD